MHRVVSHQRSVGSGVDSIAGSGAPPPGYTSQRDTTSFIAVINDDEDDEVLLKNSPPPPSTELPYRDPLHTLPSPYSIEDLRSNGHGQDHNPRPSLHPSCTHGYTQTQSQCTPVRPSSYYPPQPQLQRDTQPHTLHFYSPPQVLSTDSLFGATNEQSCPPSWPYYRCSTEEQADQHQQTTSPYADYSLSSSPYHHRRQNTCPPPLRILTYPSTDEGDHGYKEYGGEEDEGDQSPLVNDQNMMMMMMNSTATILSPTEEPLDYQSTHDLARRRHCRSSLPNCPTRQATTSDDIAMISTKTATKKSPTAMSSAKAHSPLPLTQTQPTNYVHLSRKCNPSMPTSKSRGWRRKTVHPNTQIPPPPPRLPSSSAITGTFIINPELYIPPSLLNAMEDPVFFRFKPSSDTDHIGETRKRKGSRKTNLRLEVENGGIDVDIRLVPTTNVGEETTGQQDTFCDTPVQAQASASTSTTAFSGPPTAESFEKRLQSSSAHPRRSTTSSIRMQENPVQPSGISSSRNGISTSKVTHTSSRRDKKKPSRPTTIDLRIKQAHQQDIQNQDSVKINGPIAFPLIARIHAPNPRPPFHLFASTIDIPNPIQTTDSSTSNQHTSPPNEPQVLNTRNQSRAFPSYPTTATTIRNSQIFSELTPILNQQPLPRRRTRRSLSKHRPQRVSIALSHGGGTPTVAASLSHAPSSSLTPPSQLNLASSSPSSSSSSSSPLYLHLPRTFRGPLTIHISSGHISDRLRLSEGLEREAALIRESEFSRGYFVGGLGRDNDNMDVNRKRRVQDRGREAEMIGDGGNDVVNSGASGSGGGGGGIINNRDQIVNIEKTTKKKTPAPQLGNNPNKNIVNHHQLVDDSELSSTSVSPASSSSSSPASSSPTCKGVGGEWYGDRIEILVGSGDVYLQFEDENEDDDPFFRTRSLKKEVGFWKRFFLPSFFLL